MLKWLCLLPGQHMVYSQHFTGIWQWEVLKIQWLKWVYYACVDYDVIGISERKRSITMTLIVVVLFMLILFQFSSSFLNEFLFCNFFCFQNVEINGITKVMSHSSYRTQNHGDGGHFKRDWITNKCNNLLMIFSPLSKYDLVLYNMKICLGFIFSLLNQDK